MSDAISLIDSVSDLELTLFEKIEKKSNKHKQNEINNLLEDLKDKKNKTFFGRDRSEKEDWNIITDYTSKGKSSCKNKNPLIFFQTNSDDNELKCNPITTFENPSISGFSEKDKDEIPKLDNININANNLFSQNVLIGKKRYLKEKKNFKTKEDIFNDLKKIFVDYNIKNNKINEKIPSYKIFEGSKSLIESHAIIVENKIPGCVIYFNKNIIKSIYLIREEKYLNKEDEIIQILSIIENNILKNSYM